jgi:hypothetical protein
MSDTPTAWQPDDFQTPPAPAPTRRDLEAVGALDRSNRVGRTAVQVGTPAAAVTLVTWLCRLGGIDLDPGNGVDMPADVSAAWVGIATVLTAWAMNRGTR